MILRLFLVLILFASPVSARYGMEIISSPGLAQSGSPTPYYSDNFNRSSGNLTTPWVSNTVPPIPAIGGAEKLTSSNNTTVGVYSSAMPSSDYRVCSKIGTASSVQSGPVVRASSTAYTQYDFYPSSPTNARLRRVVAASTTTLQDTTTTINTGDIFCLKVSGSSTVVLTGYINGSQVVEYSDSSGSRISSGVNGGIMVYNDTADDWEAYEN